MASGSLLHFRQLNIIQKYYVTFALLFVTWAGLAYLFFNNKKPQNYIFETINPIPHQKWNE